MQFDPNKRFDKAFARLDEACNYQKGDITTLRTHTAVIERTARDLCNDPEGDRIEFKVRENGNVFIDTTDDEALACLDKSFEKEKGSIPDMARSTIKQILENFKESRAKYQS